MTSFSGMCGVVVVGTGSALPSRLVTNADIAGMLGPDGGRLLAEMPGLAERYWCAPDESTADLAEEAARHAMQAAGIDAQDVGLLVVASDTPEFVTPHTAAVVQGRLELADTPAVDISASGADFVTALDYAAKSLCLDGRRTHAIVIGVSVMSRYLDTHDPRTAPFYADGAGAVVLRAGDAHGVLATRVRTMGRHSHDVGVFAGGTRTPITSVVLDAGLQNRLRVLREYPAALPELWGQCVQATLSEGGQRPEDVQHWFWTHPSVRAVEQAASHVENLDVSHAVLFPTLARYGYTGAASLPLALDDSVRSGRVADGDLMVLTSAGAGVALGALVLRWMPT